MNCNKTEKQKYMMLYSGIREYYSPENHFDSTMMESFFEMSIFSLFWWRLGFRKTIELSPCSFVLWGIMNRYKYLLL